MKLLLLYMICILKIFPFNIGSIQNTSEVFNLPILQNQKEQCITPMEALDLVKECYAANFDKVYLEGTDYQYYYKLQVADYYLEYTEEVGAKRDYLIHLYEFVIDEPETGLGHMVTYGWYSVDRKSGVITEQTR